MPSRKAPSKKMPSRERPVQELPVLPQWTRSTVAGKVRGRDSLSTVARRLGVRGETLLRVPEASEKALKSAERFIAKYNPSVRDPVQLLSFMREKYWLLEGELAKELGITPKEVDTLRGVLGLRGGVVEKRKEMLRAGVLEKARAIMAEDPKKVSYGYLKKHNLRLLLEIRKVFAVDEMERGHQPMLAFYRFLDELGVSRKKTGMKRPSLNTWEKKQKVLEAMTRPLSQKSVVMRLGGGRKGADNFTNKDAADLESMVSEGSVRRSAIGRRVFYFKPGQEARMQRMRRLAVRLALAGEAGGRKRGFYFNEADARELVLLRLNRPMTLKNIGVVETPKGKRDTVNYAVLRKALEGLESEGKIEKKEIRGITYYGLSQQTLEETEAKIAFSEKHRPLIRKLEGLRWQREEIGRRLVEERGKLSAGETRVLQKEKETVLNGIDEIARQLRKAGIPEKEWRT
jgi:hypothetical protein